MKSKIILISILILAALLHLTLLAKFPNGLNADEAAIGYNAYSLIQTGKDEHGATWPMVFRSFDDFKPAVYFYLVLPFVKVLGLNIWAVRLPSALLGVLSVYLLYLLTLQIFPPPKLGGGKGGGIALLSAFLLAISPWHLQFSRGGWEVNTATTFLLLGLVFFFKALAKPKYFVLWVLSWCLALYTYHSMRLVIPLLGLYLLWLYLSPLKLGGEARSAEGVLTHKFFIASLLLGLLLLLPLARQMLSSEGQSRFAGVSIFADTGPVNQANVLRGEHSNPASLTAKILHNRYYYYGLRFFNNLTKHYSASFLFFIGDEIGRSRVPNQGQSYLWTLPFFAIGLWFMAKNLNKTFGLILFWFLIGSFAAAMTFQSPHALRSQNISIPFQIIIASGIYQAYLWIFKLKIKFLLPVTFTLITLTCLYGLTRYLFAYYHVYPREIPYAWQYGFKEMGEFLKQNENKYDQIIITTRSDQPYILTAFFLKYPPEKLQQELVFSTPDQFGFSTGTAFGKYRFKPIDFSNDSKTKNTLLVVADEPVDEKAQPIHTIYYPNGDPVFRFYQTE